MSHPADFPNPQPARWDDLDTDQRTAAIIALYGLTAEAMAPILATTRSAILGHAWRHRVKVNGGRAAVRSSAFEPGRSLPDSTWSPLGPPVADPTRKQCCWPVGSEAGARQMFCGLPRAGGPKRGSYCTTHAAMASGRRATDHPYVDMLRSAAWTETTVETETTIDDALAAIRPAKREVMGAE